MKRILSLTVAVMAVGLAAVSEPAVEESVFTIPNESVLQFTGSLAFGPPEIGGPNHLEQVQNPSHEGIAETNHLGVRVITNNAVTLTVDVDPFTGTTHEQVLPTEIRGEGNIAVLLGLAAYQQVPDAFVASVPFGGSEGVLYLKVTRNGYDDRADTYVATARFITSF